ncbi:MAG TPA: ABC transporter ATP-binding protein [Mycobacteriales bacterium]|jgi:ABC-2 type transport system ATP-binding protein|nr:ABC transporter ATP-binding protein [Mycobacteriales bacterium]
MGMLVATDVTKTYRSGVRANDGVSIDVPAGEVFGLLGPNGAGKTTLVSQILGLAKPDSGSITIDGVDVVAHPEVARRWCSYQPQAAAPVDGLSAREAVELVGRIRGGDSALVRRRAGELLEALDLGDVADRPVPMSGGMTRLTGFCMAAVVPGRVVVLDEPTNDVDPLRRRALWALIRTLADDGAAVLLVTHNVIEAERCVDRLAIVAGGRVLAHGAPAPLKAQLGAPLRLEVTLEPDVPSPRLPDGVEAAGLAGRRLVAHVQSSGVDAAVAWARQAQDAGVVAEFALMPASLEDVYASWVTTEGAA